MGFPFGNRVIEKDPNNVYFDLVRLMNYDQKQKLFDFLKTKGLKPMGESMIFDQRLGFIAIPINPSDRTFGYVGVHVVAEQTYHGAKMYVVSEYIQEKRES